MVFCRRTGQTLTARDELATLTGEDPIYTALTKYMYVMLGAQQRDEGVAKMGPATIPTLSGSTYWHANLCIVTNESVIMTNLWISHSLFSYRWMDGLMDGWMDG